MENLSTESLAKKVVKAIEILFPWIDKSLLSMSERKNCIEGEIKHYFPDDISIFVEGFRGVEENNCINCNVTFADIVYTEVIESYQIRLGESILWVDKLKLTVGDRISNQFEFLEVFSIENVVFTCNRGPKFLNSDIVAAINNSGFMDLAMIDKLD